MTKVLVFAGKNYNAQQLINMVGRHRGIVYVAKDSSWYASERDTELLVLEVVTTRPPQDFRADIVLIGQGAVIPAGLPLSSIKPGAIAVFDPVGLTGCDFIEQLDLLPVTCGTGEKNTISVSSVSDGALVLTVGRMVQDVHGRLLEEQEYLFKDEIYDVHTAILACALLLLTRERESA